MDDSMGQHTLTHDPCDPSKNDPFDPPTHDPSTATCVGISVTGTPD